MIGGQHIYMLFWYVFASSGHDFVSIWDRFRVIWGRFGCFGEPWGGIGALGDALGVPGGSFGIPWGSLEDPLGRPGEIPGSVLSHFRLIVELFFDSKSLLFLRRVSSLIVD